MISESERTFLGLDLSTQQLKGAILNDSLEVICQEVVIFDSDLPEYRTNGGVVINKNNSFEITAPTIMWIKALDMLLDKLMVAQVDFSKIAAVSGTAQQHGSVYWQNGADNTLASLNPDNFLHAQLSTSFSITDSPTWMDASTVEQCGLLENTVGGSKNLAEITGSRAYERFTGSQIAKICYTRPDVYKSTERISLVSSFLASLFLGKVAPIDYSDGSGMNLMDIRSKKWNKKLLDACGPDLENKLGNLVASKTNLGKISNYFVERYGFRKTCHVVAFTGDNPASLIGMRLIDGWLAVSLGTSDTVFLWLREPRTVIDGHILCNPVDETSYMALLCFKNGSLTRERIKDNFADGSWEKFNTLLDSTPRGNFGNIGLYYDCQEILPFVSGDHKFNKDNERITKFASAELEIRATVEGQFLSRRVYAEDIGFKIDKDTKILATGGASANTAILQVLSDVFNSPVYVQETSNSAMLGAAYNAKHGLLQDTCNYEKITSCLSSPRLACEPHKGAPEIYEPMINRLREILKNLH